MGEAIACTTVAVTHSVLGIWHGVSKIDGPKILFLKVRVIFVEQQDNERMSKSKDYQ